MNNFATTSGGIGEGLMRSSAVLSQAGASLEESIAMFTAAQEIIQNAESVGTAWRTVSLRLRGKKKMPIYNENCSQHDAYIKDVA